MKSSVRTSRQLVPAERVRPGDVIRVDRKTGVVARNTGSPGRSPSDGSPRLRRLYLNGNRGYVTAREGSPVAIVPR